MKNISFSEYLDIFIDKHIIYKRMYNEEICMEEYTKTIKLYDIKYYSKILEDDYDFVFEYFKQKGITVIGSDYTLCSYYDNYKYFPYKLYGEKYAFTSSDKIDYTELEKEFREYSLCEDLNEKQRLRDILIRNNMALVHFIRRKEFFNTEIDIDELLSYGYEGLMHAIDNYTPKEGYKFSTYASICIKGFMLHGIPEILGFRNRNLYYRLINAKKELDEKRGFKSKSYMDNLDEILDLFDEKLVSKEIRRNQMNMINHLSLDEVDEEVDIYDPIQQKEDGIFIEQCNKEIMQMIDKYDPYGIIVKKYGLDGESIKTDEELAVLYGCTHQNINLVKKKALNEMSHSRRFKEVYRESIN